MERAALARSLGASEEAVAAGAARPRDVVVREREPARFQAAFAEAVAAGGTVFVADPGWGADERAEFERLRALPAAAAGGGGRGWLCLPTGGSSGAIKLARHDERTLAAAVRGFARHFDAVAVNSLGVLPPHHVSGLMAWLRAALTGGVYRAESWKAIEAGARPELGEGEWFVSLVPTQLQRMLGDPAAEAWLRGFKAVLVGGGPAWAGLAEAGAEARLPLAFCYGMTETAAMVAASRPEEFLRGARGCGRAMPHAWLMLGEGERIGVEGASLFFGYWPESRGEGVWWTEDRGRWDATGGLQVTGRRDALIITGGKKVDPAEVEAVLRATGAFADVAVVGVPDAEWGEVVVAAYAAAREIDVAAVERFVGERLAAYKRPKRFVRVDPWPRSAQGKVNRAALARALAG